VHLVLYSGACPVKQWLMKQYLNANNSLTVVKPLLTPLQNLLAVFTTNKLCMTILLTLKLFKK